MSNASRPTTSRPGKPVKTAAARAKSVPLLTPSLPRTGARGPRVSLARQAYEALKYEIITFIYKPGEYLNESQVSQDLGFGRTPVRNAIGRLAMQGLIEVIPRKGAIVKPVSLDDIMEINEVRLVNEVECVRLAAERIMPAELEALDEVAEAFARARDERDIKQLMLLDREFHSILARASRNSILAEFLGTLHERSLRTWFISLNDNSHLQEVQEEHQRVLEALRNHDAAAATAAMRDHVLSTTRNLSRNKTL